ncbi:uncharacterized protein [Dermacentor andersoni]|uniref:uncharacterized protein isoform X7 n=1 Tax=Dermacentor andersoni TaxID=34620 RepID=UPI003B3B8059
MDVEGNSFRLTSALVELAFFLILAALSAFFWVMWKVYRLILEWLEPPFGHSAHGRGHCSAHGPPFGHSANGAPTGQGMGEYLSRECPTCTFLYSPSGRRWACHWWRPCEVRLGEEATARRSFLCRCLCLSVWKYILRAK